MSSAVKPFVAGNWKMNGLKANASEFGAIVEGVDASLAEKVDVMICPPATLISLLADKAAATHVSVGGQDCHFAVSGAHTGDISAEMLADAGATAAIVGHSERRADHGESSDMVRIKAEAAWRAGLVAIICVGETEEERRGGRTLDVVGEQVALSVPEGATPANTIIAYEPVWAIGTGLTPSVDDVAEVHAAMRELLARRFGEAGKAVRLLYGGSVKPGNAKELMAVANVDGALVGGASLKSADFLGILAAYKD